MQFTLKLAFILAYLYEAYTQICRTKNTEYNQLTIVNGETFRLPLNDYFVGDGLEYNIIPNQSPFTQNKGLLGSGTISGTIISLTSSNFNNNPNIQNLIYYALTQSGTGYQIQQSQISNGPSFAQLYTIPTQGTCYSINFIQNMILLTCSQTGTNLLSYQFVNQNNVGISQNPQLIDAAVIQAGSNVTTQAVGQYVVTIVNLGTQSSVYAYQVIWTTQYQLTPITLPTILSTTIQGDHFTGMSLQENGILFISTYYTGFQTISLTSGNANAQKLGSAINPFNQGTLGVSAYSVDYSQSIYYLAIWGSQGIAAGVLNTQDQDNPTFKSAQVIQTAQIATLNYFNNQVFMNSRYLILSNQAGISVYPSILNAINDWQLLYFYPQKVQYSAFDYYNNILVTISAQTTQNYQFFNPILSAAGLPVNTTLTSITINATTNLYGITNQTSCHVVLYYSVIQNNPNQIEQQIQLGYNQYISRETYVQSGPLFLLYLGSATTVNINKMLIGPAIMAGYPNTKQAISNIDIQFSNVLLTPQINSPYKMSQNTPGGQQSLYSQVFYDASYLINDQTSENFKDTYLQLVQAKSYVALYQCQGLQVKQQCKQVSINNVKDIRVEQFALSISSGNQLYYAYMWNDFKDIDIDRKIFTGHFTICQVVGNTCKNFTLFWSQTNYADIKQIGLVQDNFYMLYSLTNDQQTVTQFSAAKIEDLFSQVTDVTQVPSFQTYQNQNNLQINSFSYNVPAYGNLIFLNTWTTQETVIPTTYIYSLTIVNYNGGYVNAANQAYIMTQVGSVQTQTSIIQATMVSYQFTIDGMYFLITINNNSNLLFYPKVDFLAAISQYQNGKLPVNAVQLNMYSMTNIIQTAASARFYYVMATGHQQNTPSIFVYGNTPSLYNALYYIIQINQNDQIENAPFSVTSAIQYDAIVFKSDSSGYINSFLLPEYEFVVQCNLNSNFQQQIEYSYVIFKASTQLLGSQLSLQAQEYFSTFESMNLISFVKEQNTASNGGTISYQGYVQLDPRQYFKGNIQSFLLTNGTNEVTFYYFNITSPVQRQPQTTNYQYPVTAVSAYMQVSKQTHANTTNVSQDQYWFTFVQTNRLVYVTPYVYYNPPQDFVDNSTIKIDYPLIYKLPVLDISPNSQSCPLIFVDPGSNGIVSVCGTKVDNKFAASFTLFNPLTQEILETKIILLDQAFVALNPENNPNQTNNGTYILTSATYLNIGVVVLQFQYNYNYGSELPTLVIFSFLYTSNLYTKIAAYPNNPNIYFYQFIQPIQQVYQVSGINLGSSIEVTPFSISTQYFGGLDQSSTAAYSQNAIIFGLLCVSDEKEQCLQPFGTTLAAQSVYINNVAPLTNLKSVFESNVTVSFLSPNNVISTTTSYFQVSLLSLLSDFTENSIQQVVQAGSPMLEFNQSISVVPLIAVSQGTAFVFNMQFYLSNAQYIESQYSCTLLGLSDQNRILKVSASSTNEGQYQVVLIVANPTTSVNNQVTLLNYGFINNYCRLSPTANSNNQQLQQIVTAIGATTYVSTEATPVLALMQPPSVLSTTPTQIPRTLISDNQVITLLDTSPYLTISAYPNYNIKGGVSLNSTSIYNNTAEPLLTSISAMNIKTYVNNQAVSGEGGSSLFSFSISPTPAGNGNKVWFQNLWGQFIWGFIMFAIIVGVVGYLFYKSQPQPYDRL